MIDIGLAWTLTLVSAYLVGGSRPELPPEQGPFGMSDDELYDRIHDGDPLGDMSFGEAVARDPRRIEALLLQRVIQPFTLAIAKIENPNLHMSAIQDAMKHSYLERNHRMRQDGRGITATKLVDANKRAWKMNSEVLKVAFEMSTPEAAVLKQLILANQQDIHRAFREAREITRQASTEAVDEASVGAWKEMGFILENMNNVIGRYTHAGNPNEVIDDEIQWIQPAGQIEKMGIIERQDLFGALSFDDALDQHEEDRDSFGYEWEEYIITGHRAPAVGLAQYRRSGGRVF